MANVRRFFYVRSPQGRVLHIMYGSTHSEGPTVCGIQANKGWAWMNHCGIRRVCKKCRPS